LNFYYSHVGIKNREIPGLKETVFYHMSNIAYILAGSIPLPGNLPVQKLKMSKVMLSDAAMKTLHHDWLIGCMVTGPH
jgi:hypothetical protein